jgi:anti-sigma-K factor RskA
MAVTAPISVKAKVMHAAQFTGKVVQLNPAFQWRFAAAASIVLSVFLGYLAYDYRDRWIHSQVALNELIAQNQQVAQDHDKVNLRLDKMENDLRIINDPSFTKVVMKGTPSAPQSLASVYWNKETKEVFLSIQNLRALSQEKQYQLWAIIDGKAVDAGVFDGDVSGLVHMKDISQGAVTFAVTIEPRGGKPSPTLESMQVAGSVPKG